MRQVLILTISVALAGFMGGCGEKATVTVYKQGQYQGKPDTQPWNNDLFKGDKLAWEQAIKVRNERQDETSRGTPTVATK